MSGQQPRVGIGVFVFNDQEKYILGKRKGSLGSGTYSLAGGHLEFGETFEDCAKREVLEETGLEIKDLKFLTATNGIMKDEGKHYITIFMTARVVDNHAEPQNLEPDKCEGWIWVTWLEMKKWAEDQLQGWKAVDAQQERRLFQPLVNLVQQRPDIVPRG